MGQSAVHSSSLAGATLDRAGNAVGIAPRGQSARPVWQGACDCHTHVFADPRDYPFSPARTYTPTVADVALLERQLHAVGLGRVIIVQPSVYGYDNRAALHAIAALGMDRARGVAAVEVDTIDDEELDALARGGMCAVRLNLETGGTTDPRQAARLLRATADRIRDHGWHIQVHARLALIVQLIDLLPALDVPVVLDHYAGTHASTLPDHPDFTKLLDALRTGAIYVKLSAGHLCGVTDDNFSRLQPLARALIAANGDRLIWGSDWPHPDPDSGRGARAAQDISPLRQANDSESLAMLEQCVPDAQTFEKIMVSNPARLYGFETAYSSVSRLPG